MTEHRWSGWPGAFCLDCGAEDPRETALANNDYEEICNEYGEILEFKFNFDPKLLQCEARNQPMTQQPTPIIAKDPDGKFLKYAWPGGYPLYQIMSDGEPLCTDCANNETSVHTDEPDDDWRVVTSEINYEDTNLYCTHCNSRIESAYESESDTTMLTSNLTLSELKIIFAGTEKIATPHRIPDFEYLLGHANRDTPLKGRLVFVEEHNTGYDGVLERWYFIAKSRTDEDLKFYADLLPGIVVTEQENK